MGTAALVSDAMDDYPDLSLKWAEEPDPFYFSATELSRLGATKVGKETRISRKACFYGFYGEIGDHARIDDFCIIKGSVDIGRNVHIAPFALISGTGGRVWFKDCASVSARSSFYTSTDDYRADALTGPTVPTEFTVPIRGPITVGSGAVIGVGCAIMPNVVIGDGASLGAGCVLNSHVPNGGVVRMDRAQLRGERRDYRKILGMVAKVIKCGA